MAVEVDKTSKPEKFVMVRGCPAESRVAARFFAETSMTEERKHAILFAAALLSARKIIEVIDNDDPQNYSTCASAALIP